MESLESQYKSAVDVVKTMLQLRVLWNMSRLIAGSFTIRLEWLLLLLCFLQPRVQIPAQTPAVLRSVMVFLSRNIPRLCKISGFDSDVYETFALLGCYVVWIGSCGTTSVPSCSSPVGTDRQSRNSVNYHPTQERRPRTMATCCHIDCSCEILGYQGVLLKI